MTAELVEELFKLAEDSYFDSINNDDIGEIGSELPNACKISDLFSYRNKISKILYKQGKLESPFYDVMLRLSLGDKAPSFQGAYHIYVRIEDLSVFDDFLFWD